MDLLRPVFSFDYMGAAEFEFGAVPKALNELAKSNLTAGSLDIELKDVEAHWRDKNATPPTGSAEVLYLCRKDQRAGVETRIRELAAKDYTLKEATRFPSTLRPSSQYGDGDTVGWLELNNAFMFFTDRDMWAATCRVFGVEVAS